MIDEEDRDPEGLMVRQATRSPQDTRTHIERICNDCENPSGLLAGMHGVWRGRD
jgi:hypothetical protein